MRDENFWAAFWLSFRWLVFSSCGSKVWKQISNEGKYKLFSVKIFLFILESTGNSSQDTYTILGAASSAPSCEKDCSYQDNQNQSMVFKLVI